MESFTNLGVHSWDAYVCQAARRLSEPPIGGQKDSSVSKGIEFAGTPDFKTAVSMARNGWQDGAKAVADALDKLPPSEEVLPDWRLDVSGSICNVPAFIAGEPECMWHMSECKKPDRRISIVSKSDYSGRVDASDAMLYAKGLAGVIRAIEASGVSVALQSLFYGVLKGSSRGMDRRAAWGITIREFGEPLDLSKVAFAFHPSFFRRIGFAWMEISPAATNAGMYPNLARPAHITQDVIDGVFGLGHRLIKVSSIQDLFSRSSKLTDRSVAGVANLLRGEIDAAIKNSL